MISASWRSHPCVNSSPWAMAGLASNKLNRAKVTRCHRCTLSFPLLDHSQPGRTQMPSQEAILPRSPCGKQTKSVNNHMSRFWNGSLLTQPPAQLNLQIRLVPGNCLRAISCEILRQKNLDKPHPNSWTTEKNEIIQAYYFKFRCNLLYSNKQQLHY